MKIALYTKVETAIKQGVKQFRDGKITPYNINDGYCDEFAMYIKEKNPELQLQDVENGNFHVDGDVELPWDWELLKTHWKIKPPKGFTTEQIDAIDFGQHVWLTDGKLHYDAECPKGVKSFFDLPIFATCLTR